MTDLASTLVVLIDADDVKHVFAAWPDHICLAACLARDGTCSMVVFRRDERAAIPQRLLQILRIDADEVSFVPQVSGFATRQFRYSDERRLMALVASDPDLLDEAIDYSVNYTYALEEGLDPAVVLGRRPVEAAFSRQPLAASRTHIEPESVPRRELSPLLPDFLRKSAEHARRPRFASVRKSRIGMLLPQT
jgi:hypothetical protein